MMDHGEKHEYKEEFGRMIEEFQQALADRYQLMEEQKAKGKKVMSWLGTGRFRG